MDERPLNDPASSSELQDLRAETRAEFAEMRAEFGALEARIVERIVEEAETTRRHFDIMVERVNDTVKVVAEAVSHHAGVLDDHERRIKTLARRRRP
ncbi:MAG: hypothetical protein A3H96_03825 [Acidobacteria bacterium RIFCSPLOWO2_02_FULL_67_36]|nr:MAG: hypothetical protein A3H96_03825 [Acidobacteria bacterium RIFCSPLOWO2_02_FULL_67_36]OFW21716.1 MAG: hypothetical protein A3G21_15100 [Acidobacteria bacterium RIFCSPLOWO2_12_FULL_66_21]